jgi:thioredoxin-dependent peroxiredoxin
MLLFLFSCTPTELDAQKSRDTASANPPTDTGDDRDDGTHAGVEINGEWAPERLPAPEFSATNRDGVGRNVGHLTDGATVLWFYPSANAFGCGGAACPLTDMQAAFATRGVEVIGVSFDDPELSEALATEESFNFELWTDDERTLARYYGAVGSADAEEPQMLTVLLDAQGVLTAIYAGRDLGNDPQPVLSDCETLFAD